MQAHKDRVANVAEQLKNRPQGKLVSIRKATPHHQIHDLSWKDQCHRIDVTALCNIIGFDTSSDLQDRIGKPIPAVVIAEGQVTMGELAAACMDRGLLPCTVPEYSNFTVAGLMNGEGIQSSSFRYGVFTHTVLEVEVLLGDGSVVTCSKTENSHLFAHLPESMGTIGIVTMAKIACRRATPWVLTDYEHFTDRTAFVDRIKELCFAEKDDFMEGLVCALNSYLVIRSNFVSSPPASIPQYFPEPHDTEHGNLWYYQYVRFHVLTKNFSQLTIPQDAIPTDQFLFRAMRGAWYLVEMHVNLPFLCEQRWFRRGVDKKVQSEMETKGFSSSSSNMSRAQEERCMIFQDMGFNLTRLDFGIKWVEENLGVYPLWICPVDARRSLVTDQHLHGPPRDTHVVDVGIYGEPTVQPYYHNKMMPALTAIVDAPSTWGMSSLTKEKLKAYGDPIRERYHAMGVFPGLEDKIRLPDPDEHKNRDLNEKPITCWRLYREYGKYWWIKLPLTLLVFLLIVGSIVVFGARFAMKAISLEASVDL